MNYPREGLLSEQHLMVKLLNMKYRLSGKTVEIHFNQKPLFYNESIYTRHIETSHIRITLSVSTLWMCTIMVNKNVEVRI